MLGHENFGVWTGPNTTKRLKKKVETTYIMCNEQSSAGNSKAASLVTVVSCYLSTESQISTVEKPDLFATLSKI